MYKSSQTNKYQLSQYTENFVEAMNALITFQEKLYIALEEFYGEDKGDDMFNSEEIYGVLQETQNMVFAQMNKSIYSNLNDNTCADKGIMTL